MLKASLMAASVVIPLVLAGNAHAAELRFLVGGAMQEPFHEVAADFQRKTGHTIQMTVDTTGQLQNKLRAGEKADLILVSAPGMEALVKENRIMPETRVALGRAKIGVAVKVGAPSPDLSSVDAFKRTVLSARTVAYVDPKSGGTSGNYMAGLFQRMGIADEIAKKTVHGNQGSEIAQKVADGEAEIGITFTSELQSNKGVRVTGFLPEAIQNATAYVAAIPVGAANADAARAFIQAMQTSEAETAIKNAGLEPIAH